MQKRSPFQISMSLLFCFSLLFLPVISYGQEIGGISPPLVAAPSNSFSGALVNIGMSTLATTYSALSANKATSAQVSSAASTLQMLFAYWEQNGTNAWMQKQISANAAAFKNYTGPTNTQIAQYQTALAAEGFAVTQGQLQTALTPTAAQIQTFLDEYNVAGGMEKLEAQTVEAFQTIAALMQTANPLTQTARARQQLRNHARLLLANACSFWGGAIALYSAAITLGCPVCAPVTLGVSIVAGAIGLACDEM